MRYVMPVDSSYVLQQDAVYTLPIRGGGPIDIAATTSLLWMALNNQVRSSVGRVKAPGSEYAVCVCACGSCSPTATRDDPRCSRHLRRWSCST